MSRPTHGVIPGRERVHRTLAEEPGLAASQRPGMTAAEFGKHGHLCEECHLCGRCHLCAGGSESVQNKAFAKS